MNTNIILDGLNAMLKQLIAAAIAEAIKPLQERIAMLEDNLHAWEDTHVQQDNRIAVLEGKGSEWKAMEHVAAKAVKPLQDRITALEINQTLVREGHNDFNEAVRNVLDGYNFTNRNEVVVLVEEAIGNHDFSNIDISGAIEEGIENYDFSGIIAEHMPDELDKDVVQQMIDESLGNLVVITQR